MSSFDDEFGLFGEQGEEAERRSTLGARKIASTAEQLGDIELEEERPRRFERGARRRSETKRTPADPVALQARASELLAFLAKRLVAKPEAVTVETFPAEDGEEPLIELAVDPEDLGKVIGRNGRVAQALRTIIRATAEGRIDVEILDTDEFYAQDAAEDAAPSSE